MMKVIQRHTITRGGMFVMQQGTMLRDILNGIRVLDFTWVLAGPYTTRILADFGAEVIKIQSLKTAKHPEANLNGYFNAWERNKRSITLDMSHPEARELLLQLAAISDVVINNFSPRVMHNWNLTYEVLKSVNERIIVVGMSAMGQTGPWKDYVAFGPSLQALSGMTLLSSEDPRHPTGLGHAYGDHVIGLYGAVAVLAALENRMRTGKGQYIDLSGYEALCTVMGTALMECSLAGNAETDFSDPMDDFVHGCYRCRGSDRWCVMAISTDEEWKALCEVLNRTELADDPRFRTQALRQSNRQLIHDMMQQWTVDKTAEEAASLLQEAGIPAGVVQNAADLAEDPHLKARQFFVPLDHPVLGRALADRQPVRFVGDCDGADSWKAAPLFGEDNEYVFVDLLGLTKEQFLHYKEKGIIS